MNSSSGPAAPRVLDISVRLGAESCAFPGDPRYERRPVLRLQDGDPCELSALSMSAHSGTHLDAPAHFVAGGKALEEFAVEQFLLPALVAAVPEAPAVTPQAVAALDPGPGEAVLFKTDNSTSGRVHRGSFDEDYVYVEPEAARCLVEKGVRLVGIDYLSIDRHDSSDHPSHHVLLGSDVLILEGIDLSAVDPGRYTLICLPLRLAHCEASPVRAVLLRE